MLHEEGQSLRDPYRRDIPVPSRAPKNPPAVCRADYLRLPIIIIIIIILLTALFIRLGPALSTSIDTKPSDRLRLPAPLYVSWDFMPLQDPRNPSTGCRHPVLGDGGGMFSISSFPPEDPVVPVLIPRPSSVAMLRSSQHVEEGDSNDPFSWHQDTVSSQPWTCYPMCRLFFDSVVLGGCAVGVVLVAYVPIDMEGGVRYGGALPYVYAVVVAIAGYEYTWLAHRVQSKLLMAFRLYEKQTSREMYRHIIAYAVDNETCAVTWVARKVCGGKHGQAAVVLSILVAGGAVGLCFVPGMTTPMPMIYIGVCTFVGTLSAALVPNMPAAACVMIRYAYFFLSSLNVVLRTFTSDSSVGGRRTAKDNESGSIDDLGREPDTRRAMDKYLVLVVESYSLLLLAVCLLLIVRAVTSKDSMESALMIMLDVAGLLYLSCSAAVLELFEQSTRVEASGALAGFFAIVWSAEVGAFLTELTLQAVQFPWLHPLSMVSSQQNVEKVLGAIGFAAGTAFVAVDFVEFDMNTEFIALVCAAAVVCAHVGKLFLVSLKKIANVTETGSYLYVGGGVLDRIDTLLFMAIVFAPFFQRAVYNQPQW